MYWRKHGKLSRGNPAQLMGWKEQSPHGEYFFSTYSTSAAHEDEAELWGDMIVYRPAKYGRIFHEVISGRATNTRHPLERKAEFLIDVLVRGFVPVVGSEENPMITFWTKLCELRGCPKKT